METTMFDRDFGPQKDVVRRFHAALDSTPPGQGEAALSAHCADGLVWRGFHPFGLLTGADTVAAQFWTPLRRALTSMQRREDVFMAGLNEIDGFSSVWVVSMGHLMGLFDEAWLGIPPTGKMAFLRYCAFYRVDGQQITETAMYFDIPHLMVQAGLRPFASQTAAQLVQPGPMTHDGLMTGAQPAPDGAATLALINAMISDLGTWSLGLPLEEELRRTWAEDMIWWGPTGIGATYTIPRYAAQHSGPFRAGFTNRTGTGHLCRLAEGHFGGFFGWPNFTAQPTGKALGLPQTDQALEFRVIDIYRRAGDKLAENWVFIDMCHLWNQLGVDIIADAVSAAKDAQGDVI